MKELGDMSLEELWQLFPIILEEYNPHYPAWYESEAIQITQALQDCNVRRLSHIGSTAVEGLISKPTVDILLEMPAGYDLSSIAHQLEAIGWGVMARNDHERTMSLKKGYTPQGFAEKVFHLHVKPYGDWGELYFRDYLRQFPDVARQYEALKISLQPQFKHDRDGYTAAKTEFVAKYTQLARVEFACRYQPSDITTH